MVLNKDKLYLLEIETYKLIEEAFKEKEAFISMSIISQFANGFYLLRKFLEDLDKLEFKDKQLNKSDKGETNQIV
jgi:hypothetical protein